MTITNPNRKTLQLQQEKEKELIKGTLKRIRNEQIQLSSFKKHLRSYEITKKYFSPNTKYMFKCLRKKKKFGLGSPVDTERKVLREDDMSLNSCNTRTLTF